MDSQSTPLAPLLCQGIIGPGVSQALVSSAHQCRSTEVRSKIAVVVYLAHCGLYGESLDSVPDLNYMLAKPTAAKARPVPVARALGNSDDPQVLNLPSWQLRYKPTCCPAARNNFTSFS